MKKIICLFVLLSVSGKVFPQVGDSILLLTLNDVVEMARRQSPSVLNARHSFRSSYWNYVYYKANFLPSLTFTSSPNFNHSINSITLPDGTVRYIPQNLLRTDASLSITQNIALTGGAFFIQTALQRTDILNSKSFTYKSTPVTIGYQQSLLGYNSLKWDRKLAPLQFETAKKTYIETLELVAANAVVKFFNLAYAQTNMEIAVTNYANADTLYSFAKGRYEIGTITENEMLQLEVNRLSEESNQLNTRLEVDERTEDLRSYLGIKEPVRITVQIDNNIPLNRVDIEKTLLLAVENSPDILNMEYQRKQSESNLAYARGNAGLKADLFMQLGLAQTGENFESAYQNPLNQQYVEIGISFPILDWGRSKGKIQVAKSNRDIVYAQTEQDRSNFEQNVTKVVNQFNLLSKRLEVAVKTDLSAERRNEIARKLYMLGKSNILDLNASIADKDAARRNYISTLSSYWGLYYTLRSLTLFDFEKNIPITEDYQLLIK
ncbi:MAG: TolC family protein [Tannerella sp.]|jgi:outer membrane protein TolC|nr:TolC family protein [Tannerella sp.]